MPEGWIRGPQGQLRPTAAGARAKYIMELATRQRVENVEKPDISPNDPDAPEYPIYGPGLPLPPRQGRSRRRP